MTYRMTVLLAAMIGCAHSAPQPQAAALPVLPCNTTPPVDAVPVTPTRLPMLVGRFRLIQEITSDGPTRPWNDSYLELHLPDSADRAAFKAETRKSAATKRRILQLAGRQTWPGDSSAHIQPAAMIGGVLYLGCRHCDDRSPDNLTVSAVSATGGVGGFWGNWNNLESGNWVIRDRDGRRLASPAGTFCALRVHD